MKAAQEDEGQANNGEDGGAGKLECEPGALQRRLVVQASLPGKARSAAPNQPAIAPTETSTTIRMAASRAILAGALCVLVQTRVPLPQDGFRLNRIPIRNVSGNMKSGVMGGA